MKTPVRLPTPITSSASFRTARARPPLGRSLFRALWVAPLWALPFAVFFIVINGPHGGSFVRYYLVAMVFATGVRLTLWALEAFVLPWLAARRGGMRPPLVLEIALYGLAGVSGSYLAAAIVHFTLLPGFLGTPRAFLVSGMFALMFTVLFGGVIYATVFYRAALDRARAVEHMRAELAQAELRALRAQINPHFLFNTLNTIASLIRPDPAAAEDTTMRLADLFRHTLRGSEREHSPLSDELRFLRDYLAIQQARFGERLRIAESIMPGLEELPVPSLLLQPLVENAVRHGIGAREAGGTIALKARRDGETLVIEVCDDGPGMAAHATRGGEGFGLHSVRERLATLGPPHALTIESSPTTGTCVRVTLPVAPVSHVPVNRPATSGDPPCDF